MLNKRKKKNVAYKLMNLLVNSPQDTGEVIHTCETPAHITKTNNCPYRFILIHQLKDQKGSRLMY